MRQTLPTFKRIAAARCEREERRRLAANRAVLDWEAEREHAAAQQRAAEARQEAAAAALLSDPAGAQAQLWRQVCRTRAAQQAEALHQASAALADAQAEAAEARRRHERREQQARLLEKRCAADRLERERRREDAEDDERVHRPRSVFNWTAAR